jgi:hypothetical protein
MKKNKAGNYDNSVRITNRLRKLKKHTLKNPNDKDAGEAIKNTKP